MRSLAERLVNSVNQRIAHFEIFAEIDEARKEFPTQKFGCRGARQRTSIFFRRAG